jgi:hypothetical protein
LNSLIFFASFSICFFNCTAPSENPEHFNVHHRQASQNTIIDSRDHLPLQTWAQLPFTSTNIWEVSPSSIPTRYYDQQLHLEAGRKYVG